MNRIMETAIDIPPYLFLTVLLAVALLFALVPLGLARIWAALYHPKLQGPEKTSTYECGVTGTSPSRIQFKAQFYHYGILFLIFGVEAVFLLPFAVVFLDLPLGAVLAMMVFILLLVEGLVWAWLKGILTWK